MAGAPSLASGSGWRCGSQPQRDHSSAPSAEGARQQCQTAPAPFGPALTTNTFLAPDCPYACPQHIPRAVTPGATRPIGPLSAGPRAARSSCSRPAGITLARDIPCGPSCTHPRQPRSAPRSAAAADRRRSPWVSHVLLVFLPSRKLTAVLSLRIVVAAAAPDRRPATVDDRNRKHTVMITEQHAAPLADRGSLFTFDEKGGVCWKARTDCQSPCAEETPPELATSTSELRALHFPQNFRQNDRLRSKCGRRPAWYPALTRQPGLPRQRPCQRPSLLPVRVN